MCFYISTFYILSRLSNVRGLHRKQDYTVLGYRTYSNSREFD